MFVAATRKRHRSKCSVVRANGLTRPARCGGCEAERCDQQCEDAHAASILSAMASTDRVENESGIEIKPVYTADDASGPVEPPGEYPYTRGPYADMYRGRPWTIRQYAGFASAEETNARFRYLLERGQTGLSIAFDLPTQLGMDSDDPRALGEVGRTGVAIDSIADMEILLAGIPLSDVSTSMTINGPAPILLAFYIAAGERQGVDAKALRGTVRTSSAFFSP